MDQRMKVRTFILNGKIRQAIYKINEINPLVSQTKLYANLILFFRYLIKTKS